MKVVFNTSLTTLFLSATLATCSFAATGGDTFKGRCAPCHGATGAADTTMGKNLKISDLGSDDVQKKTDDDLSAIIATGKNKMPAYGAKLSKEQIVEVVKFIRTLKK
jgi:mono/diheme cytochrome c family protein